MKKILYIALPILVLVVGTVYYMISIRETNIVRLPTYFNYTEQERATLKGLSSKQTIRTEDLFRFDQITFDLVAKNTTHKDFTEEVSKIYAYVAVAQRDFAYLSHNASDAFEGSVDPISKEVLCIFFKDDCAAITTYGESDPYSKAISALVLSKVKARIAEDTAGLKAYPIKVSKEYWDGPQPSIGIANGNSKGWFITSGSEFRAPPPPTFDSKEFADQVILTKKILIEATAEEKRATVFWAGGPGTKTPPGQLLALGDDYMQAKTVPLSKVLLVRSVLTMAVADAVTAVFDSKYTYFVKRPFMMDPSIITIMPTPNHPSYPAGHSTLSAAGATVLKYYFPEDTDMWEAKTKEAGLSRIWGGIHYMMDHEAGVVIGKSVGEAAVKGTPPVQ